jgi:serine phosphatase RsbU (regulator of sigma subunit)/CHASE2 domain-containing sensor protein
MFRLRPFIFNTISFSVLIFLLVNAATFQGLFEEYEVKTLDRRFKVRPVKQRSSKVILIMITDDCIDFYGQFPWPRSHFAKVIKYLTEAGVEAIGFDVLFPDPNLNSPEEDQALVDATGKSGKIFFPLAFKETLEMGDDTSHFIKKTRIFKPFDALAKVARGFGFIDVKFKDINPDGVIRRVAISRQSGEFGLTGSLGLAMAASIQGVSIEEMTNGNLKLGDLEIPVFQVSNEKEKIGTYYINFNSGDSFEHIPFSLVMENELEPEERRLLKDKIVIIGTSATSLADLYFTPEGLRPGVEIHAHTIRNILDRDLLSRVSPRRSMIVLCLLCLFTGLITGRFTFFKNTTILAALIFTLIIAAHAFFEGMNLIVDMVPPLVAIFSIYVVNNFFMMIERLRISRDILREKNLRLDKKVREMEGLNNIAQLMTSTFTVDQFFKELVVTLKNIFEIKKCSILLYDRSDNSLVMRAAAGFDDNEAITLQKRSIGSKGSVTSHVIENREAVLVEDMAKDPRFSAAVSRTGDTHQGKYKSSSFISCPILINEEVEGIINLTDKVGEASFTQDDLNMIMTLAYQVAIGMQKMEFLDQMVEQHRMEKELQVGFEMQSSLLPQKLPHSDYFEIYASLVPAKEIGGDLYQFMTYEDGSLGAVVGDVAGKGVQAGLFMAMASVVIKGYKESEPGICLQNTNKNIVEYFDEAVPSYLTAVYARFEPVTRRAVIAKAGHEPPIFIDGVTGEVTYLEDIDGMPIGMFYFPDSVYEQKIMELREGDTFIFYTDGYPEATNLAEDILGRDEFLDLIQDAPKDTLQNLGEYLYVKAKEFQGEAEQFDDMTIVIVRVRNLPEKN